MAGSGRTRTTRRAFLAAYALTLTLCSLLAFGPPSHVLLDSAHAEDGGGHGGGSGGSSGNSGSGGGGDHSGEGSGDAGDDHGDDSGSGEPDDAGTIGSGSELGQDRPDHSDIRNFIADEVVVVNQGRGILAKVAELGFSVLDQRPLGALGLTVTRLRVPRDMSPPEAQAVLRRSFPNLLADVNSLYRPQGQIILPAPDYPRRLTGWARRLAAAAAACVSASSIRRLTAACRRSPEAVSSSDRSSLPARCRPRRIMVRLSPPFWSAVSRVRRSPACCPAPNCTPPASSSRWIRATRWRASSA